MFSSEFYEISKNTFSYGTPLVAASVPSKAVFVESEADTVGVQYKMVFLKKKSTCAEVFFNKVAGLLLVRRTSANGCFYGIHFM